MSRALLIGLLLSGLLLISAAVNAAAQPIPATFQWQVSADGGMSWTSSVNVAPSQTSVLVRLRASWQQAAGGFFAETYFDGLVLNSGPSDTVADLARITSPSNGRLTGYGTGPGGAIGHRLGSTIKLDRTPDTSAPGAGIGWIDPRQNIGDAGAIISLNNPITMFQYRLNLDGSLGTRTISGLWRVDPATGAPWAKISGAASGHPSGADLAVTFVDAQVIVPTPAGVCVGVMGGAWAMRRRRVAMPGGTPSLPGKAQANQLLADTQVAQALRSSCRPLPGFSTPCECGGEVHAPTLFGLP
jgi:hypothetical protein